MEQENKIWYVKFPTYQYNENVVEIARKKGLIIVDEKFKDGDRQVANAPKLTLKGEEDGDS